MDEDDRLPTEWSIASPFSASLDTQMVPVRRQAGEMGGVGPGGNMGRSSVDSK